MADKGFAIRCPYCLRWNVWEDVRPKDVALDSEDELKQILKGLQLASQQGKPDSFLHPKLLRCGSPRWLCPSSFEAFICRSEKEAFKYLNIVEAWSFKRDFRLYKADCSNRWENKYYGILFCTQPVPRLGDVELEVLMDRELLSRLIVGVSVEIEAPLTVYAANIFKPEGDQWQIYWMPVEGYSWEQRIVPPGYNQLCNSSRDIVIKKLSGEFASKHISVSNCPIWFGKDGKCAGRQPACMQNPEDWNHCPAFIKRREKECPCYISDREAIRKVEKKWREGESMENGVRHRCCLGFEEVAFPIVVHGHLSGVAMTGQVFFNPQRIADVDGFLKGRCEWNPSEEPWELLQGSSYELEKAKRDLVDSELKLRKDNKSRFFLDGKEFDKRIAVLRVNITRISEVAESRYRDFRGKSESVFRQEMLGCIQGCKKEDNFFEKRLPDLLERMRQFWAFQGSYLLGYSYEKSDISLVGYSNKRTKKAFGIPGRAEAHVAVEHRQTHPCPFLWIIGQKPPRDTRLTHFLNVIEKVIHDSGLEVSQGEYEFGALIPFSDEVYTFVFAIRDKAAVSTLERLVPGGVSQLCQDAILETCTQVIYEFGDIWYREASLEAWRGFSALACHRVGNEITTVGTLLDVLAEQLMTDPSWKQRWADKFLVMKGCITSAKIMLIEQATLTAQVRPELKVTNVGNLVRRAVLGVLPPRGQLNFEASADQTDISVDPDLMEQAFRELATNAVQATGEMVQLTIGLGKTKDRICVSFRDNGPGIPHEQTDRMFEPFVTLKGGGMGLGLATVKHIVEAHGGTIVVAESHPGANFIISLPRSGQIE